MLKTIKITAVVLFFVLIAVIATHSLNSINQDIGRHLKSGQIIWEMKRVYKTNLFSFTEPNFPFINHHWLGEVVLFLLNGLVGLKGLIILKVGLIVATFGLIYQAIRKQVGAWAFLIAGIFGIFVFSSRTDVRPEIFSYLFLAIFLTAIFKAKYEKNYRWLYALPAIQLLWTNMHIYFALGPGLLFLFLIDRLIHKDSEFPMQRYLAIFLAASAVTLINPNFIKGALEPLNILRNYGYSIEENQSIFLLQDFGIQLKDIFFFQISLVLLIVSFFIALKNHRTKITFEFLTATVFSILAVMMIRNFGIYSLVFVPIAALNLNSLSVLTLKLKAKLKIACYSIFIICVLLFLSLVINNSFYQWLGNSKQFGLLIPNGSINGIRFIKQNNIQGPVFNNFDVGSLLIWQLYPAQKVFVDGRPEAYSVDFFEKIYKPMQEDPRLWQKYSELYKINYVFVDRNDITDWGRKFLYYISQNPDWPLIYFDANTAIFIKRKAENQKLIDKFQIK